MSEHYTSQELMNIAKSGLREIGYRDELLRENYLFDNVFTEDQTTRVELAAFAQEPLSYRSACFGFTVIPNNDIEVIKSYRALGAPHIFSFDAENNDINLWQILAQDQPKVIERIRPEYLFNMIRSRQEEWKPEQVLRAKSINFVTNTIQLDFSDIGLLPVLEEAVHQKLDRLLRGVVASSKALYTERHLNEPDYQALFRLIFRFVAAKLLGDRQHLGNWLNNNAQEIIKSVDNFYFGGATKEAVLEDEEVQNLAWQKIRNAFNFQNLSVEALAYVYENTFVNSETRKEYSTHSTPYQIAEFIVGQLPFEKLAQEERRIFEPFAGAAPFLLASLSRLRALLPADMSFAQRHDYFVKMLAGMELDAFACEVARYSLILADYPNSNGWNILNDNFFTSSRLENYLTQSQIVLCNPPYEDFTPIEQQKYKSITLVNKAAEALHRVLETSPEMLGFVLPQTFVDRKGFQQLRGEIALKYKNISLVNLPDNAFQYSDVESVLLIAHTKLEDVTSRKIAIVEKKNYPQFLRTGEVNWQTIPTNLLQAEDKTEPLFWLNPLSPIWEALVKLPCLEQIVEIHRGVRHNVPLKTHSQSLVSMEPKSGFVKGIVNVKNDFEPYINNSSVYLNADPELRRDGWNWAWDKPKVIVNEARLSISSWRLAAFSDQEGLIGSQRFYGVWPLNDSFPLEVISALLNSPVANAFLSSQYLLSRDNQIRHLNKIPIPRFSQSQIEQITSLVKNYRFYRLQWLNHPEQEQHFEILCRDSLYRIDAEVLKAYDLPPRLERDLLNHFNGHKRPGPIHFTRYYPADFRPAIPWHLYISEEFKASSAQRTLERLPLLHDPIISAVVQNLD